MQLPNAVKFELGLHLDLPDLLKYCKLSKSYNKHVCNNYRFWLEKIYRDYRFRYNKSNKIKDIRNYYQELTAAGPDKRLHEGAALGQLEAVIITLEQGANIHALNDEALRFASENGHLDVVKYLKSLP